MTLRIAIIGAGIGGLTAAIAGKRRGFDVQVYEQAQRLEPVGAGIQLSANATRVLRALGLLDSIRPFAFAPQAVQLRDAITGRSIARLPLGDLIEARHAAPYWQAHRGDLQNLLLEAAVASGVPVHFGRCCESVIETPRSVAVRFADGATIDTDVLIGADGIHSRVRSSLFAAEQPRYTGFAAWRGLLPATRLPAAIAPSATVWIAPHKHFVHYYVRGGQLVNFVGVVEAPVAPVESWSARGDVAELANDFAGWHPAVQTLIGAVETCFKWALYDRPPMVRWSSARATLLGDACHPMLPFLAQGAAMAIEDAWVLIETLVHHAELERAFVVYERLRKTRTRRVVLASRAQGEMFHLNSRWAIVLRDLRLRIGSSLPGLAMRELDWLHGYDATTVTLD